MGQSDMKDRWAARRGVTADPLTQEWCAQHEGLCLAEQGEGENQKENCTAEHSGGNSLYTSSAAITIVFLALVLVWCQ